MFSLPKSYPVLVSTPKGMEQVSTGWDDETSPSFVIDLIDNDSRPTVKWQAGPTVLFDLDEVG